MTEDVMLLVQGLIGVAFLAWLIFGPFGRRERAHNALERRGICPEHLKPFTTTATNPEYPGAFSQLCEDCIPEYEEKERKRLEYLMKAAR